MMINEKLIKEVVKVLKPYKNELMQSEISMIMYEVLQRLKEGKK